MPFNELEEKAQLDSIMISRFLEQPLENTLSSETIS